MSLNMIADHKGSVQLDIDQELVEQTAEAEAYVNSQVSNQSEIRANHVQHDDISYHPRNGPVSITSTQPDFRLPITGHVRSHEQPPIVDMSNYLLKKDLLLHRFTAFDDSAQNYTVWKVGFLSILK